MCACLGQRLVTAVLHLMPGSVPMSPTDHRQMPYRHQHDPRCNVDGQRQHGEEAGNAKQSANEPEHTHAPSDYRGAASAARRPRGDG